MLSPHLIQQPPAAYSKEEQDLPPKETAQISHGFHFTFKTSLTNPGSIKRGNKYYPGMSQLYWEYIFAPAPQGM